MRDSISKLLLIQLVCCGVFAATVSTTNAAPSLRHQQAKDFTEVRLITPFTVEGLNPKVTISKRVEGKCWSTSMNDSSRPNAWRCQADHKTYDPCFVNTVRPNNTVICLSDPWKNEAVEITLKSPLPSTKSVKFNHKSAQPWALELANGNHCTLISGPSLFIAGMKTGYQCKNAVLIGELDRSKKFWTVLYHPNDNLFMNQEHVTVAWY